MIAGIVAAAKKDLIEIPTISDGSRNRRRVSLPVAAEVFSRGGTMALRCRPGRPRKSEADRDPLSNSLIAKIAGMGLVDQPQRQAAEAFVFLSLLVHGAPSLWPDYLPPRARLAELAEERCPAMFGAIEDGETIFAAGRVPEAIRVLLVDAESLTEPSITSALLGTSAPAFLDPSRPGRAFDALQNSRRGLNRLCKLFQIPRRDTELMGEGP